MMLGFFGYVFFVRCLAFPAAMRYESAIYQGLIIGVTYDRITTIVPLFIVMWVFGIRLNHRVCLVVSFSQLWVDAVIGPRGTWYVGSSRCVSSCDSRDRAT